MTVGKPSVADWIEAFKAGDGSAGNRLLSHYEPWLRLLARHQLESRFKAKFDSSDLVQQALLEAVRAFPEFRGNTEPEFAAWLRQILAHALAHEIRRYRGTQKRRLDCEVALEQQLATASGRLGDLLAASATSPSRQAIWRDDQRLLAEAMERLPEDYRRVILLRHVEGLTHEEIAHRLGRPAGAVRMLWVRALARLRSQVNERDGAGGTG